MKKSAAGTGAVNPFFVAQQSGCRMSRLCTDSSPRNSRVFILIVSRIFSGMDNFMKFVIIVHLKDTQILYVRVIRLEQGIVVLLNGTSSAGKTSISNELINQKEILFHHLSIDDFFNNFNEFIDVDDQVIAQIIFDPIGSYYYATIKLISEMGLNVIADTVIDNDKRFNECLDVFIDQPTLFVGVICSKEELIRREQIRGDRQIGLASSQFDKVYCFDEYDLEVNTEELNPVECAEKILGFIKSNKEYSVFKKLSKRNVSVS